ncbi:MAG: hypothetical protein MJE66_18820 [Proteobacteria bacterium]|nr:hypothetical protein [Pseudomonadota bacterium]
MADSPLFEFVANALEQETGFTQLEARGTLRLALREAGLNGASATRSQMIVVIEKILPGELRSRGIEAPEEKAQTLLRGLAGARFESDAEDTPADMFRRIAES